DTSPTKLRLRYIDRVATTLRFVTLVGADGLEPPTLSV
ncbi:MAG: hypothetical protein QOJ27_2515, partial [Sphingomonadales bacterium]|nr:hypothetical protein [Sphingomonadales bacterium]